jgi:hypothetical protein
MATTNARSESKSTTQVVLAWLAVGIPLAWGVAETIAKTLALFR